MRPPQALRGEDGRPRDLAEIRSSEDSLRRRLRRTVTQTQEARASAACGWPLEHFPEKWTPVFRRKCDHA